MKTTPTLPVMSGDLAREIDALMHEIYWVNLKFTEYSTLYGHSEERINLLNAAAPRFFGSIEYVLWTDLLLHLTKIAAPPESMRQENLTVQRLPNLVAPEYRIKVQKAVDDAVRAIKFAKKPRDKIFAHTDRGTALEAIPSITLGSRQEVRDALSALLNVINVVEAHYGQGTQHMIDFTHGDGGAENLIELLKVGLNAKNGVTVHK